MTKDEKEMLDGIGVFYGIAHMNPVSTHTIYFAAEKIQYWWYREVYPSYEKERYNEMIDGRNEYFKKFNLYDKVKLI